MSRCELEANSKCHFQAAPLGLVEPRPSAHSDPWGKETEPPVRLDSPCKEQRRLPQQDMHMEEQMEHTSFVALSQGFGTSCKVQSLGRFDRQLRKAEHTPWGIHSQMLPLQWRFQLESCLMRLASGIHNAVNSKIQYCCDSKIPEGAEVK
jgi:hypothetical protein